MPAYHPKVVEPKWQKVWDENKTFKTSDDPAKPKYYILDMFPYPSGAGLHVGHPEGYTATDILARYKRMRGCNVLHPMGWDAFGLPAEQYAIQTGTHPRDTTQKNINEFRRQIKMLGFSYDWDREVDTTDPNYFKWTQWIFLQLYDTWYDAEQKKGRPIAELPIPEEIQSWGAAAIEAYQDGKRLAYQAEVPVNWCAELGTVLANEEVVDGKSERGGYPVVRMPLKQWLLRITEYAERLIDDLALVDWPDAIKKMQRDWIGKSEGAEVDFEVDGKKAKIRVFTTRPDTLFGATYMVLSPEHPLVDLITTPTQLAPVSKYKQDASRKSDLERTELAKKKTGVFTGAFAINPVNQEKLPIWIADYVLASYGTGAIMAVPAHDERDFDFAQTYRLPVRPVVLPPRAWLGSTRVFKVLEKMSVQGNMTATPQPNVSTISMIESSILNKSLVYGNRFGDDLFALTEQMYRDRVELFECFSGDGVALNSGDFTGTPTADFKRKIAEWLESKGKGAPKVNYKLRDWLFSRQRYWGEPFPILHELDIAGQPTGRKRMVPAEQLPLRLPEMTDYQPSGRPEPPLGKAKDWVHVVEGDKSYLRETNTMPQWAGSCWYYLRYIDARNEEAFADPKKLKTWLPVDLYVGGAEHAVLHLLYSRFWHKVLFDRGYVPCAEPFQRLVNQGMILGVTYFITPEFHQSSTDTLAKSGVVTLHEKSDSNDIYIVGNPGKKEGELTPLREDQIEEKKGRFFLAGTDLQMSALVEKMSKSRGNVINPDEVVADYGTDSLRLYEMFMGPLEATKPWSMRGVEGVFRFLNRVWRLVIDERAETAKLSDAVQDVAPDAETLRKLHFTIKKVTDDLDNMSFNTAISAMMELTNYLTPLPVRPRSVLRSFMLLLAPFAPHLAEELWQSLGGASTLAYEPWPTYDASLLVAESVEVPIQINGKVRGKITVAPGLDKAALETAALADEKVKALLDGKAIKKVIAVPGKMVNLVIG